MWEKGKILVYAYQRLISENFEATINPRKAYKFHILDGFTYLNRVVLSLTYSIWYRKNFYFFFSNPVKSSIRRKHIRFQQHTLMIYIYKPDLKYKKHFFSSSPKTFISRESCCIRRQIISYFYSSISRDSPDFLPNFNRHGLTRFFFFLTEMKPKPREEYIVL